MRLILVVLLLAGCVSPEQRALNQAAYAQRLRNQCAAYGFEPGPQMSQCMMQLDQANRQNAAMSNAAMLGMSQQMIQNSGPQPIPSNQTTCTMYGNTMTCR